ncbi:MAG TPA: UDP-N-acetylmuramoyl-L-alanyl-D-glutamate--2,6-diaminopimelate ligase [Candidatus Paceibacterota bacterium]|nr:UDP-N-acetylmuramoyl-L-alanyl-D-glutamate--2,6-diaminopimelate ligase [Candidatus Paceibacterota bacterium]
MTEESLERLKRSRLVRRLYRLPWLLAIYHYFLSFLAAWRYGFPSRRMTVIGVTGTKGKTSTANLLAHILNAAGHKTGLATTVNFAIGDREWTNETKQTMLGRLALQKLLREMADAGCRYAIVETSSEGIAQFRHRFIRYAMVVFTNISPEHIERHGSFENYRAAKVALFEHASRNRKSIGIYNLDDRNVEFFLEPDIKHRVGFSVRDHGRAAALAEKYHLEANHEVSHVALTIRETMFQFDEEEIETALIGEFNVYNVAAAMSAALALGVPSVRLKDFVRRVRSVPGRCEVVNAGQPFTVIVDYAHEPASLTAIYETVKLFKPHNIIGLLGAQGGGRDVWKRAEMGKIAARNCDVIVLANEDPYDEDPMAILNDIESGIREVSKDFRPVYKIIDRRAAIRQAMLLAKKGDAVVLTGKGGEVWMCVENGRKIAWNERAVVEDILSAEKEKFVVRSGRNMLYQEQGRI